MMTYIKLSGIVRMCEEAFAILVMESNWNWWIYFVKKEIIENKALSSEKYSNDEQCKESSRGSLIGSLTDDNSYDSIPDLLYQNNISKGKTKKVLAD